MNVPYTRIAAVILPMILICSSSLVAQKAPDVAAADDQKTVTRVYDVKAFVEETPDYPLRGERDSSERGGGQGLLSGYLNEQKESEKLQEARVKMLDELRSLIKDTVDPESWRDNGGALGNVRLLGNRMIVTQTPANQQLVGSLLDQLLSEQQRVVRVRANWITLDESAEAFVSRQGDGEAAQNARTFPVVDVDGLVKANPDALRYRGEIVCFNGQTVHLSAGPGRLVMTDLNPVVGQDSVGYDPDVEYLRSGATLQITPTIQQGGVVVDLLSAVNELDPPTDERLFDAVQASPTTRGTLPLGGVTHLDRFSARSQEFATTAVLPVGKPVLIGGMTMPAKGPDAQQLYLVLEVIAGE